MAALDNRVPAFCYPWEFFCNLSLVIFLAKDRSPENLAQLNLGVCDILESSIFSCTHIVHLIVIT